MSPQIINIPSIRVAQISHVGPYDQLSQKFDELFAWVELNDVPIERTIGIYYDNPEFVPANRLRSSACVEIPASYPFPTMAGSGVELGAIAGGQYAKSVVRGPYEALEQAWSAMISAVEEQMGHKVSEIKPAFEVYVNDPANTAPEDLLTELYCPIG